MRPIRDLMRTFKLLCALLVPIALIGCAGHPHRPYLAAEAPHSPCAPHGSRAPDRTTPEIPENNEYTLHYIEFDDQGWLYPDKKERERAYRPDLQIECALADLSLTLRDQNVRSFVFIHGWHHSAKHDDGDLNRFRNFLKDQAALQSRSKRRVMGFYIAWHGESVSVRGVRELTVWARKNAAGHVAEGSVREFFARLKAIRENWNRPDGPRANDCGEAPTSDARACPLRTVMIGHSFGGLILFSATSPYLIETLAKNIDSPPEAKKPTVARERGIADLVILLNPAFEASRYEPLHQAARRYVPKVYEPPLLVSVTSRADGATRALFPVARFFSSVFQLPATSDKELDAMLHTHGHLPRYHTHQLHVAKNAPAVPCRGPQGAPVGDRLMRERFLGEVKQNGLAQLDRGWKRKMCDGLMLTHLASSELDQYSVVWNIHTSADVIPSHTDIIQPLLISFVQQLYVDVREMEPLPIQGRTAGSDMGLSQMSAESPLHLQSR